MKDENKPKGGFWKLVNERPKATVVIVMILFIMSMSLSSDSSNNSPELRSETIHIGEEGFLRANDASFVLLGASKESYDAFLDAQIATDSFGTSELLQSGLIFSVPADTKILVIDSTFAMRKVRILEGERIGQIGWVPYEFVVKK